MPDGSPVESGPNERPTLFKITGSK
jgi:hypothetical protein